jgi:hypothetical protein
MSHARSCLSAAAPLLALALLMAALSTPARAEDRHAGYYYPEPQSEEIYRARVPRESEADRRTRIAFTTGLTNQMLRSPSPPRFAIFAKGAEAEKLILVAVSDGSYNTLYRLRALMAMLTAYARSGPAFQGHPHPEDLTFLDLIYLIGFEQITVSDGREIAHTYRLAEPNP